MNSEFLLYWDSFDYSDNYSQRCLARANEHAVWCWEKGLSIKVIAEFSEYDERGKVVPIPSSSGTPAKRTFDRTDNSFIEF